jgi:hypothetical protein
VKEDQKKQRRHRGRAGRSPPVFDPGRYKQRNTVETSKPRYCHSRGLAGTAAGSFLFGVHQGGLIVQPGRRLRWPKGHMVQGAQALDFGRILSALPVTGVTIE